MSLLFDEKDVSNAFSLNRVLKKGHASVFRVDSSNGSD